MIATTLWTAVIVASVGCYLLKLAGRPRATERPTAAEEMA